MTVRVPEHNDLSVGDGSLTYSAFATEPSRPTPHLDTSNIDIEDPWVVSGNTPDSEVPDSSSDWDVSDDDTKPKGDKSKLSPTQQNESRTFTNSQNEHKTASGGIPPSVPASTAIRGVKLAEPSNDKDAIEAKKLKQNNNPFWRKMNEQKEIDMESSASIWNDGVPQPTNKSAVASSSQTAKQSSVPKSTYDDLIDLNEGPELDPSRNNNPFEDNWRPDQQPPDLVSDNGNPWEGEASTSRQAYKTPTSPSGSKAVAQAPQPPPRAEPNVQRRAKKAITAENEVYQIKHIRWHDGAVLRQTPILIQNANGPCPLLALVNALTLSTPPWQTTTLVNTLVCREQISLNLLLDAVFEELMSGRRLDVGQSLPDVGELYQFLVTLHTGMNVNPNFVPDTSLEKVGSDRLAKKPKFSSYFEDTQEMRLYSTFGIPLVHGWLADRADSAYGALSRAGRTYEDAQKLLFREEELEQKNSLGSITASERELLQDLRSIKAFLDAWPTQLTSFGMDTIQSVLDPGEILIFFRNDHFSTAYKQPKTNQIMTLVTDAGYATHDEIVWESLVDINGSLNEMFSGDFRSVSHSAPPAAADGSTGGGQWNTANHEAVAGAHGAVTAPSPAANMTAAELEDYDLALALQLQEEEEERHRRETGARNNNNSTSQQHVSSDSSGRPEIPVRRSGATSTSQRHVGAESEEETLPSYEQAAAGKPYNPLGAQNSGQGRGSGSGAALYGQNASRYGGAAARLAPQVSRRMSRAQQSSLNAAAAAAANASPKDDRCNVM